MKAFRYRLPLIKPLKFGGTTIDHREGILLHGEHGWAEAAPLPEFSRERLEDVMEQLREGATECAPSLAFARDALSRPLCECRVPINALVQGHAAEILTRCRELAQSGCKAVKLKIGRSADVRSDIELVLAVGDILRSDQCLRLDANRAWNLETARIFADGCDGCAIEYIEEPLRDPAQLEKFHRSTGLSYALDETLAEVHTIENFPNVAALVVKPTILGCREPIEQLAAAGKPLVFSACFESGVGITRVAQLANEFSPATPAGLDTYSFLASDVLTKPLRIEDWNFCVDSELAVRTENLEEIGL